MPTQADSCDQDVKKVTGNAISLSLHLPKDRRIATMGLRRTISPLEVRSRMKKPLSKLSKMRARRKMQYLIQYLLHIDLHSAKAEHIPRNR